MADDIGFECLSINGSTSYKTPVIDSLARTGVNFTRAISQPLCTPSRVKIMTGKRNYKNYEYLINCKDIDIVYIALPNSFHFFWINECIRNNKNINETYCDIFFFS